MDVINKISDGAMSAAAGMVDILYDHMDQRHQKVDNPTFGLTWHLGAMRLSNGCEDDVLTIEGFELRRANNKKAITAAFITTIIRGRFPLPRHKIAFLHFWAPHPELKEALRAQHFHPYRIGSREDYWHVVDGQGDLL